ncbi:MAG: hypothetical protein PHN99_07505 [Eubacteriales bacterium]|nr:hypothetical protein [Eubacteriales bacterium]MDD4717940.1 hypothetical protein [Eubacteriales bacterium]
MTRSNVTRIVILILTVSVIVFFTGCSVTPGVSDPISSSSSGGSLSDSSLSGSVGSIMYQLFAQHGKFMLKPASSNDYNVGKLNGTDLFYQLSEDGDEWEPADSSVTRMGSVTGHSFYEDTDSTYYVYKVPIGDWIGYCKRPANEDQDEIERRILIEDNYGSGLEFGQKTLDHTVLQIFDDLYSIGSDDVLKMASSRVTGQYDYAVIDKTGIGDFLGWSWIKDPVCDPYSDSVFYLTSREGEFYNIWKLDLGDGTENRHSDDDTLNLKGLGDGKLIAFLDQITVNDPFGKLISLTDPGIFTVLTDKNWNGTNGWLYLDQGLSGLRFIKGDDEYDVDLTYESFMVFAGEKHIWIVDYATANGPQNYHRIDTDKKIISSAISSSRMRIEGWNDLLISLAEHESPAG